LPEHDLSSRRKPEKASLSHEDDAWPLTNEKRKDREPERGKEDFFKALCSRSKKGRAKLLTTSRQMNLTHGN